MIIRTVTDGRQRYDLSTQLDGQSFRFEFSWNARGGFWSFILSAADGTQLLRRRVVVGTPLTARFADPRLPPGDLVALDTSGKSEDPGLTELGGRVQLVYLEAQDIAG